jgi:hypothetical protein
MSAPTVEVPATAPPMRLTAGGLIGFALGLMVLAGAAAFLLLGRGGPLDGRAEMTRVFGSADLPFGLQITSASVMPSGEKLVAYASPNASPPPPPVEKPKSEPGVPGPRKDWSAVAIPDTSEPPDQATFLIVDKSKGRSVIDALVRGVQTPDTKGLGPEGGTVLMKRGRSEFRGWESDWIHLRTFEAGGTFRDAMRISISTPDQPVVLTATWPRGNPATQAMLDELLKPLRGS